MSKSIKHIEARILRQRGWSMKDISEKLEVAKSSASNWCRDITLTKKQIDELHKKMIIGGYIGRLKGAHLQRDHKQQKMQNYFSKSEAKIGSGST